MTTSMMVLQWLINHILQNQLMPGDVLPGEVDIAHKLSTGRSSVREAMGCLKAFGVARSQQGVGMILLTDHRRVELMSLFSQENMQFEDYKAARQMRAVLELGAADLMLKNVRRRHLQLMDKLLKQLKDEQVTPRDFEIQFHEVLAELSGNKYVSALSMTYLAMFEYHMSQRVDKASRAKMPDEIQKQHVKIVEALRCKDEDKLKEAFSKHLKVINRSTSYE